MTNDACLYCDEPVLPGDSVEEIFYNGVPTRVHWECSFRAVIGGVNHIEGRCSCCGGTEPPDPPGVSKRDAAWLAVRAYYRKEQQ